MAIQKAEFKAFSTAVREISDYAVENPRASPINVVYFFREELRKLFRSNPNFDEKAFLDACRRRETPVSISNATGKPVEAKPPIDISRPDEWD